MRLAAHLCKLGLAAALVLAIGAASLRADPAEEPLEGVQIAGILTDARLGELSGLDASLREPDRFWALNDGGNGNFLFLLDSRGRVLRQFEVAGTRNVDWEDLVSFQWRGQPWLLIADSGDNAGKRDHATLYLLPEPAASHRQARLEGARSLHYRYEDGPHDVEAVTVDPQGEDVLLLTKRTVPSSMFRIPLTAFDRDEMVIAERIAILEGIPQPTEEDIERDGPLARYRSQPTAMDIDCSGNALLVLSYDSVYRYRRRAGQSWAEALTGQDPGRTAVMLLPQAESLAFDRDCRHVYIGSEKVPSPLLRFRYRELP